MRRRHVDLFCKALSTDGNPTWSTIDLGGLQEIGDELYPAGALTGQDRLDLADRLDHPLFLAHGEHLFHRLEGREV